MQALINNGITALTGISQLKSVYLHTLRKQQKLVLQLAFLKSVDNLPFLVQTTLTQNDFIISEEYPNVVSIELPYATHDGGYGDDLDLIPNRTLRTWAKQYVEGLLLSENNQLLNSNLITFYWETGNGTHSLGTNLLKLIKLPDSAGQVVTEIPQQFGGTLALCQSALIFYDGQDTIVITFREIEKINISESELTIVTKERSYEFHSVIDGSFTDESLVAYFRPLINHTSPWDKLYIRSANDIPKNHSIEFYVQLFNQYYKVGELDESRTVKSCQIAQQGLDLYPESMRLLDISTKSFLLTGSITEQYHYFKKCAQFYTGQDSYIWKNVVANSINSVVMLGDIEEMNDFYDKHYAPDHEHSPRAYFHNMACVIVLIGQLDQFESCMEKALELQETSNSIIGESDFDTIRDTEMYKRILATAVKQDEARGTQIVNESVNYAATDYLNSFRLGEFHSLLTLAKLRNPHVEQFLRELAVDKLASSLHRKDVFYLLIALGGEQNLIAAKKAYQQFEHYDSYQDVFSLSDSLSLMETKNLFKQNLTTILGNKAKSILRLIK